MSRLLQPLRRSRHFSATVGIKAFLWGGTTSSPDKTELKYPYFYDFPEGRWTKKVPSGTQPQGYHSGSCSSAGNCIYLYGGQSEQGENQGSLFEFSSETLSWKKLEDSSTPGSPLKKRCCGMITHGEDLIIFGGYANDDPADPVQQGSQLVRGRTNELHIYSLTRSKFRPDRKSEYSGKVCFASIISRNYSRFLIIIVNIRDFRDYFDVLNLLSLFILYWMG